SRRFADVWLERRSQHDLPELYLAGQTPAARDPLRNAYYTLIALSGATQAGFAPLLAPHLRGLLYMPGYREYVTDQILDAKQFEAPEAMKDKIVAEVKRYLWQPSHLLMRAPMGNYGRVTSVDAEHGRFRFKQEVEVLVFPSGIESRSGPQ